MLQVTTYKAITVNHGAHHTMKREESIPEGTTFPSSKGSARGSGSSNTNLSSGTKDEMMETWCVIQHQLVPDNDYPSAHMMSGALICDLNSAVGRHWLYKTAHTRYHAVGT